MIKNMFDLKGKTVVITGGTGYLGSSMSEALASFNSNLFVLGTNLEKNQKYANFLKNKYSLDICFGGIMDIRSEKSIKNAFTTIIEKTGKIDVVINNAAFSRDGAVDKIENEDWCAGIDGTINGVFRVSKCALNYMLEQKKGNIINIASMYGMVAPNPEIYGDTGYDNPANYGAGKAAIIQFSKYIAATYGRKGIRANSISPGPFPSCEVQENKWFINNLASKTTLGRIGEPQDLQGIIVFLASDASAYLTGQNIALDGGWTSW